MDEKQIRKQFWERAFLDWQMRERRRANLGDFAKYLEVGFTTLSGWANGGYTPAADMVRKLAAKLGPEIYEIYSLPLDQFEQMRVRTEMAISEIQQTLAARGVDPNSAEGRSLAADIFSRWGFEVRDVITAEPVTLSSKT